MQMTSLGLLFWVLLGLVVQVALFLGHGIWVKWRELTALKSGDAPAAPAAATAAAPTPSPQTGTWKGFRPFKVVLKQTEDAAGSICSFYLQPLDGQPLPDYKPGQFLTFSLDVPGVDGQVEEVIRCYSLSDAPQREHYRVSIKRVSAPPGTDWLPGRSSNYFHDHVSVGTVLKVRAPSGHFHIDTSDAPVVLVAGGIGITPMVSMANWIVAHQPEREVWLYYGVRNSGEAALTAPLHALASRHSNFRLRLCFSDPLPNDKLGTDYHHTGRIGTHLFRMELPLKPYHFYICGPTPMMETLVPALDDWGVPDDRIHFEAFGPASIKRPQKLGGSQASTGESNILVTFAKSGKTQPWSNSMGSLLEFAETHGIAMNSGCRAGGCGSCQTQVNKGEVTYQQAPDFDPEPGSCLPCVCTPKTSLTLAA
jgi:ferredoxin-NADP reductase